MNNFKYELIMWFNGFLKIIPGNIGCYIRKSLLPIKCGKNVKIWDNVHIDSPSKLTIGRAVSINRGSIINAGGKVSIGNNVLIGPNVTIYSQTHNFDDNNRLIKLQGYKLSEVIIGDNCWIGAGCIILPGVHIHNNCVIAAGTIITKNISKNSVVRNRLYRIDRVR